MHIHDSDMILLRRKRLSVSAVKKEEFDHICQLGEKEMTPNIERGDELSDAKTAKEEKETKKRVNAGKGKKEKKKNAD